MTIEERAKLYKDIHQFYNDKVEMPERDKFFYQIHITLHWFTLDDVPNWCFSFDGRKVRNGSVYGILEESEIKVQKAIWERFIGKEMPFYSVNSAQQDVVRAQIYEYPEQLFEKLKGLSKEKCVHAYQESKYKWHLIGDLMYDRLLNFMTSDVYPYHLDPQHDNKEITKMVCIFETEKEYNEWVDKFINSISIQEQREDKLSNILDNEIK